MGAIFACVPWLMLLLGFACCFRVSFLVSEFGVAFDSRIKNEWHKKARSVKAACERAGRIWVKEDSAAFGCYFTAAASAANGHF